MKKKRIVENDKAKILQTIKELDQKKNVALNLAWQKVPYPARHHSYPNIFMNSFYSFINQNILHLQMHLIKAKNDYVTQSIISLFKAFENSQSQL